MATVENKTNYYLPKGKIVLTHTLESELKNASISYKISFDGVSVTQADKDEFIKALEDKVGSAGKVRVEKGTIIIEQTARPGKNALRKQPNHGFSATVNDFLLHPELIDDPLKDFTKKLSTTEFSLKGTTEKGEEKFLDTQMSIEREPALGRDIDVIKVYISGRTMNYGMQKDPDHETFGLGNDRELHALSLPYLQELQRELAPLLVAKKDEDGAAIRKTGIELVFGGHGLELSVTPHSSKIGEVYTLLKDKLEKMQEHGLGGKHVAKLQAPPPATARTAVSNDFKMDLAKLLKELRPDGTDPEQDKAARAKAHEAICEAVSKINNVKPEGPKGG